jgi:hypothetical protein
VRGIAGARYHSLHGAEDLVISRAMTFSSLSARVSVALVVCGSFACPKDDDGENVLPTQGDTSDDSASSGGSVSATESVDGADTTADATGGGTAFPQAYRFECVEIQILGDADGDALQAQVLENTWNSDIDNYKLNIVFELVSRDDAAGTGTVGIRSGVGTGAGDLCAEATSESDVYDVTWDAALTTWEPVETGEVCSAMAAPGTASGGTYTMTLPTESTVFIYAQDTDGTTFNCTADRGLPDAVPIRAVEATLTASVDGGSVAGNLLGCLREDEAEALCSCLGMCNPEIMNENCGGCPNGSIPLRSLLGDINPSQRCTDLLGGNAYDIGLGFTASALPSVPQTCE